MAAAKLEFDVLVVGEINPDIIVADPNPVPIFGQTERMVDAIRMTVGSSSAIFACAAARLGLRVAFFGVVGDDLFGRFMLDSLTERGVDITACEVVTDLPTGATIVFTRGQDRAMLTAAGAIGAIDIQAIPIELVEKARHVHVGSFFLQKATTDRLPAFFASIRSRGLTTSFDPNWDPTERWDGSVHEMLVVSDLFFPNGHEVRLIAGIEDAEGAARTLVNAASAGRSEGGPTVVVKLGEDGAFACRAGEPLHRVRAMRLESVDTTGAGDAFDAGFLAAWLDGQGLRECLRWGAASGALSTRALGGIAAQATREEVMASLRGWPTSAGDREW
jgi:sugar/nucleoside kinase (ribokinase family)